MGLDRVGPVDQHAQQRRTQDASDSGGGDHRIDRVDPLNRAQELVVLPLPVGPQHSIGAPVGGTESC